MIKYKGVLALFIFALSSMPGWTQSPSFYHLSTTEGLSDNNVITAARDQNGLLWIGTSEGLNSFDGNHIHPFNKHQYPMMASNNIQWIEIDDLNRIWLRTKTKYVNMLDQHRKIHLISVGDSTDTKDVTDIVSTQSRGLIALKQNQHYVWSDTTKKHFEKVLWFPENIIPNPYAFTKKLINDRVMFYGKNRLVIVDYKILKVILNMPLKNISYALHINDDEIIAFTLSGRNFYRISISKQKITATYDNLKDQHHQPIAGDLRKATKVGDDLIVITSRFSGLYYLNLRTLDLHNYKHDPLDPRSIGGNNPFNITYDSSGYVFITTQTSGLHYYNTLQKQAASKPYFINKKGEVFDGYIQSIWVQSDSVVWLGTQDKLIHWNRKQDHASFVSLLLSDGKNISGKETIRIVKKDKKGLLWIGTTRYGVLIVNDKLQTIAHIKKDKNAEVSLPSNWINGILEDSKGNIWVATMGGTQFLGKVNFKQNNITFSSKPILVNKEKSWSIFESEDSMVWIGTENGIFAYDNLLTNQLHINQTNGLVNNTVYAIQQDDNSGMYFGTAGGLSVLLKYKSLVNYNKKNGLRNDRCEGILKDDCGNIWIGNQNCLLMFDPSAKTFNVYEEGNGFSHAGFRMRSAFESDSGEMFWGTDKGLVWFHPDQIGDNRVINQPFVHRLIVGDNTFHLSQNSTFTFPYNTGFFRFFFSSGDLTGLKKINMLVKLDGYDEQWRQPSESGQITYNRLPPSQYSFMIKTSVDGKHWIHSSYLINIIVLHPWWQTTWFRFLYVLMAILSFYLIYTYFQRKRKEREMGKIMAYFSHSEYENASVEDILWDICRNVIFKLDLEDCVIYMVDDERQLLVQKAALGSKNPKAFEIINKIEIPFGEGIVGYVATTGKSIIVNDTSKDSRYIVDDAVRYSEITIPIIHENKVIGILDSENHKKNFFNKDHLHTLENIAAACAGKISRAIALDAMKKSKLEVMELNMKMAESKFLNLRLQMNPHFLFNSLSSIQHLIVSQQTTKAYKYLTVFSNFIRSLLKYADQNFILLDEELKILKMYIELESLRFDDSFSYDIIIDANLDNDEVFVPSLMVQPFVENAIWHGLLHKDGSKKLIVRFSDIDDEFLVCSIEDNGIGRANSLDIQKNKISAMVHESKGISIIEERLSLLQQKTGKPAYVKIEDLFDNTGKATGTKVLINIPYYNPEER